MPAGKEQEVLIGELVTGEQVVAKEDSSLYRWRERLLRDRSFAAEVFLRKNQKLPENQNEPFPCPFHQGEPGAAWYVDPATGRWMFRDCQRGNFATFNLVECFAALETGMLIRFNDNTDDGRKEFNKWLSRLAIAFDRFPPQARKCYNQVRLYISCLKVLPLLTEETKAELSLVMEELGREFTEGAVTGRPYSGASERFLAEKLRLHTSRVNQACNYLCCLRFIAKTEELPSLRERRPERFVLNYDVSCDDAAAVVKRLGIRGLSSFRRKLVEDKLGVDFAAAIFRQRNKWTSRL